MTEADIISALARHHEGTEWAFLTQVRNETGFARQIRTADALAMSLWPSRGIFLQGYEVKVSRGDLKKELASPEKAEEIARFCRTWFIAAPKGLCKPEELPLTWGLVTIADGGKLHWAKAAVPNMEAMEPTWKFVAAIFRNVGDTMMPKTDFNSRLERFKADYEAVRSKSKADNEGYFEGQFRDLQAKVSGFQQVSGLRVDAWDGGKALGEAVRIVRDIQSRGGALREMEMLGERATQLGNQIKTVLDAVRPTPISGDEDVPQNAGTA